MKGSEGDIEIEVVQGISYEKEWTPGSAPALHAARPKRRTK